MHSESLIGVPNHQLHDGLLNRLFMRRSKKRAKLRVTDHCEGNSPVTGEFPTKASNAENVSIWWRHHGPGKSVQNIPYPENSTIPATTPHPQRPIWYILLKFNENTIMQISKFIICRYCYSKLWFELYLGPVFLCQICTDSCLWCASSICGLLRSHQVRHLIIGGLFVIIMGDLLNARMTRKSIPHHWPFVGRIHRLLVHMPTTMVETFLWKYNISWPIRYLHVFLGPLY